MEYRYFKNSWRFCFFLVIILHVSYYVNVQGIDCRFFKGYERGTVSGFVNIEQFDKYLIRCGNEEIQILEYSHCRVGYIKLPLESIKRNYPNVKNILWLCKGICIYDQFKRIKVLGCKQGKFFCLRIDLSLCIM